MSYPNVEIQIAESSTSDFHTAVKKGDLETVECFLNSTVDAAKDKTKSGELHFNHGIDLNARDKNGMMPLHVASMNGYSVMVENLLNYGASVDSTCTSASRKGFTSLHLAVEKGHEELVELLLSKGANVNATSKDKSTPLHVATKKGDITMINLLLKLEANVNAQDKIGKTVLHIAVGKGSQKMIELFLINGADINVNDRDNLTPLHVAVRKGNEKIVQLLLERGANVDAKDKNSKTVLYVAVEKGRPIIVDRILEGRPDVDDADNRKSLNAAIMSSVRKKYDTNGKIVESLVNHGFTVDPESADVKLLYSAVEHGYLSVIEDLLNSGVDLKSYEDLISGPCMRYSDIPSKDVGYKLLVIATKKKNHQLVQLLINHGIDVNAQDLCQRSVLSYAVANVDAKMTATLLRNGASIKDSIHLFKFAVQREYKEIVEIILQHNPELGNTGNDSASRNGNLKLQLEGLMLANACFDIDAKTELDKFLPSGKFGVNVAGREYSKNIEALAEFNGNVNFVDENGATPLHVYASEGNEKMVEFILHEGADVNAKRIDRKTALHEASLSGHEMVVDMLLKCGADIDSKGGGCTALEFASVVGHAKVVEVLLKYGSNIDSMSPDDLTPLELAMSLRPDHRIEEVIGILIQHTVKMLAIGLHVSERNLRWIDMNVKSISDFLDNCKAEVDKLKDQKIGDSNVTFYRILTTERNRVGKYANNKIIVEALESRDCNEKFPIYFDMMERQLKRGQEREALLNLGVMSFNSLCPNGLPDFLIKEMLSHLSNNDLENLNCVL